MFVKISNRSEVTKGEPLGCPGVILMLDSDLVNYLCHSRAEVFDILGEYTVVVGFMNW